mgnify:CR=1 FL=1
MSACQTRVVLRDKEVYRNEISFFQMALEQDTELLEAHLANGKCSCGADGVWSDEICEMTAQNILVIRHRLTWHVAMMHYNAGLSETRPPIEPEVPETSSLCLEK